MIRAGWSKQLRGAMLSMLLAMPRASSSRTFVSKVALGWVPGGSPNLQEVRLEHVWGEETSALQCRQFIQNRCFRRAETESDSSRQKVTRS